MKRQIEFKREFVPAYRDYFITLVRNNGEREPHYLPYAFRTLKQAQLECDKRNPHYKHGQLVVEFIDRPDSWGLTGTIRF